MSRHVAVDFACNDPDNGAFAGRAGAASVFGNDLELDPMAGVAFTEGQGWIRIHRRKFRCAGSRHWVGNWCWNRYFFTRSEYRRLIRTLAEKGWRCTAGLARWGDAYEALIRTEA